MALASVGSSLRSPSRVRRIRTALGLDFLLDPADSLSRVLLQDGVYEVPETDLVTRLVHGGDICIDAGCHVGYFTCLLGLLAGSTGRVYAFDANPTACEITRRNLSFHGIDAAEVIQAALGDQRGTTTFNVAEDDHTGLSSLGLIPAWQGRSLIKETISVPFLRLEDFLHERRIRKVRLLKLDVEGAEEGVLRGLGRALEKHTIDFILIECYDERLKLLNTSTERVAALLQEAGYLSWEYGTESPAGWSRTARIISRDDCNYLFASSTAQRETPAVTLAAALQQAQASRNELEEESDRHVREKGVLQRKLRKRMQDLDFMIETNQKLEADLTELRRHHDELLAVWDSVQRSAGWRMLNRWRRLRDWLAPERSRRRKLYEAGISLFRQPEN